jgi:uncharacterized coiled-coil DUF342 family protein
MVSLVQLLKDKRFLYAIIILQLFIIGWVLFTNTDIDKGPYEQKIERLQQEKDSLDAANLELQLKVDNMFEQAEGYERTINELNSSIGTLKRKTNEIINSVDSYSQSELEKFFSDRYRLDSSKVKSTDSKGSN